MRLGLLTVISVLTLFSPSSFADWHHDFGDGQTPASWEIMPHPIINADTNTITAAVSDGVLQLAEMRSLNEGGTVVIRAIDTSERFTQVRIATQLNLDPSVGTFMGVTLEDPAGEAYLFGGHFAEGADRGTAWLTRVGPGGITNWGSREHFGIETLLDIDQSYYFELDVLGDTLNGRIYEAPGGTPLINMTQVVPNPLNEPGFAGVFTDTPLGPVFDGIPTGGTFDNVSAKSLPLATTARRLIFSEPENVLSVSSNRFENFPHLSKDGLRIYFSSDSPNHNVNQFGELPEVYMAERPSVDEPFGERQRLGGRAGEVTFLGSVSEDERSLYFLSFAPAAGPEPMYVVTRDSVNDPFDFANAVELSELGNGQFGHVSSDSLRAHFHQNGPRVATRAEVDSPFGDIQPVGASTNHFVEYETEDGLKLFSWARDVGGEGAADLFVATRSSTSEEFGSFQNLGPVVNSSSDDTFPFFHEGTSILYFSSDRPGTTVPQISEGQAPVRDIWQSKVSFAGDFDFDGVLSAADIELLSEALRADEYHYNLDNNQDGNVDVTDRDLWISGEVFANTYFGDANLDGEFNSGDLTAVFQAGEYEDNVARNSTWAEGDWNGDGDFDSGDLIVAFQDGGYEQGPKAAVASVPEPTSCSWLLATLGLAAAGRVRRRSRRPIDK